jgi:predicted  nucleic acid-binding Zn-ribbon protein
LREKALPEVPPILQQFDLSVEINFVNQLSRAQQVDEINNIGQFMQAIMSLAQIKPEVLDYIDGDGLVKRFAKIQSIPEEIITNEDTVQKIREQRQRLQELQMGLSAGNQAADIGTKMADMQNATKPTTG